VSGVLLNVPEQRAIPGVDTRPGPLRDWLGALPYVDSEKSATLVIERLRDINHQLIPAGHRLELLAAFRDGYGRLHEGLRDNARHQEIPTRPRALELLTDLTETLAFGYKYALRDALGERQRWGRNKQLAEAIGYSMHFLALLLICRYQAYHPVSDQNWREIGDLVRFTEAQDVPATRNSDLPYVQGELHALTVYRQLALLRLADPYRLPGGQIWEVYAYIAGKVSQIHLLGHFQGDSSTGIPTGVYGISLDHEPQQSLAAPGSGVERSSWRWLDARELLHSAQIDLDRVLSGVHPNRVGFSNRLTGFEATQLLGRMLGQWSRPSERKTPRFNSNQTVDIAPGLAAAYYFLNNCSAFNPLDYASPEDEDAIDYSMGVRRLPANPTVGFRLVSCPTRNRSSGGLALYLEALHDLNLRVGELVLLNAPGNTPGAARDWLVGVVRWQVRRDDADTELGVQYVARNVTPAAVRTISGAHQGHAPALKSELTLANGQHLTVLITPRGLYRQKAVLELQYADQSRQIRCSHLLETASGFDRFSYEILG
jgi:cyclic-di-GMP-binding protein